MDDIRERLDTIEKKTDIVIEALKKFNGHLVNQSNVSLNRSLNLDKKLKDIEKKIDNIELNQNKLDKMESILTTDKYIRNYSADEIIKLHEKYPWDKISRITGLSVSTLRSRVRSYKRNELKNMDIEEDIII